MTTKSGTRDYHGNLFWFNQNNFLNAALFQTNLTGGAKPPVHFNEYGGTFGGPVWIPKVPAQGSATRASSISLATGHASRPPSVVALAWAPPSPRSCSV